MKRWEDYQIVDLVSNPGRNVWDLFMGPGFFFLYAVSNPGRNVWDFAVRVLTPLTYRGFKSRKERLGLKFHSRPTSSLSVVSNPGRNVWDGDMAERGATPEAMFQIPEGTFGTSRRRAKTTPAS